LNWGNLENEKGTTLNKETIQPDTKKDYYKGIAVLVNIGYFLFIWAIGNFSGLLTEALLGLLLLIMISANLGAAIYFAYKKKKDRLLVHVIFLIVIMTFIAWILTAPKVFC
jgi:hypothetical protein